MVTARSRWSAVAHILLLVDLCLEIAAKNKTFRLFPLVPAPEQQHFCIDRIIHFFFLSKLNYLHQCSHQFNLFLALNRLLITRQIEHLALLDWGCLLSKIRKCISQKTLLIFCQRVYENITWEQLFIVDRISLGDIYRYRAIIFIIAAAVLLDIVKGV